MFGDYREIHSVYLSLCCVILFLLRMRYVVGSCLLSISVCLVNVDLFSLLLNTVYYLACFLCVVAMLCIVLIAIRLQSLIYLDLSFLLML